MRSTICAGGAPDQCSATSAGVLGRWAAKPLTGLSSGSAMPSETAGNSPRKLGIDARDAFGQRRMGREEAAVEQEVLVNVAEEEVTGFFGVRRRDACARPVAADLLERATDAERIARELNRGRIRQVLALATDRSLDQLAEQLADHADHQHAEADDQEPGGAGTLATAPRREAHAFAGAKDQPPEQPNAHDAEHDAHQANVQAHVAVEHVAELVRDHALQLVARELFEAPARDCDRGVVERKSGRERVDADLVFEHEHLRHRHTGGDRHLLDHVEQALLEHVARVAADQAPTQHLGDLRAAAAQRKHAKAAGKRDDDAHPEHRHRQQLRLKQRGLPRVLAPSPACPRSDRPPAAPA